jgi:hypothetical protein
MPDDAIPWPGAPTIKALESLSELLGWQTPTDPVSLASVAQVPRAKRPPSPGRVRLRTAAVRARAATRTAANVYNFSFWQ